ncbi:hypothetical protein GGI15_003270 [Coemansia interrupta]|uniref:PDZ domain-containing protein n=1 Tax=Coemansia interrupta TaxID=1126814 RepID=A0A9W8LHZ8_9FUNG|nr:hypothetical protein GGI15_003270 [Coemansia interrupta]
MSSSSSIVSPRQGSTASSDVSWNTIQERLRDSVVSIDLTQAFHFDTENAHCSNATGFVVDAELGIIVSNRHVMNPGPSYHKAKFFNNVEIFLQPRYYDPIHDFSIFRYNPSDIKTSFKPKAIPLCPEKAYSGMEYRIVGNNCNEKMSVHPGELSQLDRNVPYYGEGYNDMNTFYIQSSTTSNGGSSGSPVVNIHAEVVALMAGGGRNDSSTYFLPLDRVVYALDYIKRDKLPPRGTLQAIFKHITFNEAEKHGLILDSNFKEEMDQDSTGVLTVSKLLPQGPAHGKLQIGDIIISIDHQLVTKFVQMSEAIDSSVGKSVVLHVFRNNDMVDVEIPVQDLFDVTPSKMLCVGGTYMHNMSLQFAANNSLPISGVVVTNETSGFFQGGLSADFRIIDSINGVRTPNLDSLIEVLDKLPSASSPIAVGLKSLKSIRDDRMIIVSYPSVTLPDVIFTRSRATGFWSIEPYTGMSGKSNKSDNSSADTFKVEPPTKAAFKPSMLISDLSEKVKAGAQTVLNAASGIFKPESLDKHGNEKPKILERNPHATKQPKLVKKVGRSIVTVTVQTICNADGSFDVFNSGSGLVVNKDHGIILCSTRLVANPTCQIKVSFDGLNEITSSLAYSHPVYPISFIKCNPKELKEYNITNLRFNDDKDNRLAAGSDITMLYLGSNNCLQVAPSSVVSRGIIGPEICSCCTTPTYYNIDQLKLSFIPDSSEFGLGVICNKKGDISGLWTNIPACRFEGRESYAALDISIITRTLKTLVASEPRDFDDIGVLDVEYKVISPLEAKALGVNQQYIEQKINSNGSSNNRSIYAVKRILQKKDDSVASLQVGDVILKIGDKAVTHLSQLLCFYNQSSVELTIVRNQQEIKLTIPLAILPKTSTRRVINWAGIYMQEPWLPIYQKSANVPSKVFSFVENNGSPVYRETVTNKYYIVEIDNTPIETLDDVVAVAKRIKSKDLEEFNKKVASNEQFTSGIIPGRYVKVRIVSLNKEETVMTLLTNDQYFPAWEAVRGPDVNDKWSVKYLLISSI